MSVAELVAVLRLHLKNIMLKTSHKSAIQVYQMRLATAKRIQEYANQLVAIFEKELEKQYTKIG